MISGALANIWMLMLHISMHITSCHSRFRPCNSQCAPLIPKVSPRSVRHSGNVYGRFHFAAAQSGAEMLCESNVVIGMNSAPGQTPIVYVVLPLMTLHRSEQKNKHKCGELLLRSCVSCKIYKHNLNLDLARMHYSDDKHDTCSTTLSQLSTSVE